MILLDVAMGPIYAIMGGTFLLVALAAAAIIFVAIKLIRKAMKK